MLPRGATDVWQHASQLQPVCLQARRGWPLWTYRQPTQRSCQRMFHATPRNPNLAPSRWGQRCSKAGCTPHRSVELSRGEPDMLNRAYSAGPTTDAALRTYGQGCGTGMPMRADILFNARTHTPSACDRCASCRRGLRDVLSRACAQMWAASAKRGASQMADLVVRWAA